MSSEGLLITIVVGLIAGWLAGQIVRGVGFGVVGDLVIGIVGAFIGSWLLPQLGIRLGSGIISEIINATVRRSDPFVDRSARSWLAGVGRGRRCFDC